MAIIVFSFFAATNVLLSVGQAPLRLVLADIFITLFHLLRPRPAASSAFLG